MQVIFVLLFSELFLCNPLLSYWVADVLLKYQLEFNHLKELIQYIV